MQHVVTCALHGPSPWCHLFPTRHLTLASPITCALYGLAVRLCTPKCIKLAAAVGGGGFIF